jgi:rhodanese-related sulfurtransferase
MTMLAGYTEISPAIAHHANASARFIDVREPHERDNGYIAGSENVPLGQLMTRARYWDKDGELILVCRSGARSSLAAKQLAAAGFTNVRNLTGGMIAYAAAGLAVQRR